MTPHSQATTDHATVRGLLGKNALLRWWRAAAQAAVREHDHVMAVAKRQMQQNAPLWMQIIFFMGWCANTVTPCMCCPAT